jgi:hypothetical protein
MKIRKTENYAIELVHKKYKVEDVSSKMNHHHYHKYLIPVNTFIPVLRHCAEGTYKYGDQSCNLRAGWRQVPLCTFDSSLDRPRTSVDVLSKEKLSYCCLAYMFIHYLAEKFCVLF